MKIKKLSLAIAISSLMGLFGADVVGQGFLKTNGGSVITCSGNKVYLEKMYNKNGSSWWLYQAMMDENKKILFLLNALGRDVNEVLQDIEKLNTIISDYDTSNIQETMCDTQGNFEFYDVKPGKYLVGTTVEWYVGGDKQGGKIYTDFILGKKQSKTKVFITK